jgi:hypothetical protein
MRRIALIIPICGIALTLGVAPEAAAQKKQKDPVLHQYLIEEFSKLTSQIASLNERLNLLEGELAKAKQQQGETQTEVRNAQNVLKIVDSTLTSIRLSTQGELLSLKTDLTQLRQDVSKLVDVVQRGLAAQAPPAPMQGPAAPEGYITTVGDKDVTINLGSSHGVKVGMRFNVYRATDPKTQIGLIEVIEVLDANNSKASIVFAKPDTRFEFSDVVRPVT